MDDRAQPQRKEKKQAEAQAAADLIARFEACQAKCVCTGPCGFAGLKKCPTCGVIKPQTCKARAQGLRGRAQGRRAPPP